MSKKVIFDRKNILVTGGAGFIGSHLCDDLVKNNKVICVDNFLTGNEKNIDHLLANPNFEFIKHDINESLDIESLAELQKFKIEFQGIQEIYNLACPMSPKNFNDNKIPTVLSNSVGLKNILELVIKYDAKLLHFSSSVVYGHNPSDKTKKTEREIGKVDILSERSAYDEGKRFAETMVVNYREKYNLDAKIARIFRVFGPRMPMNDKQMIPDFVNNAMEGKDLVVFGDESFSSSFCYVDDCVDAVVKLMHSDIKGPMNIGSDVEKNIVDVAKMIIENIGSSSNIVHEEEHFFMKPLCIPDISMIKNELGWMPVMSFEKGLEKTIYELKANKGVVGVNFAL